jgi:hypothetical protein
MLQDSSLNLFYYSSLRAVMQLTAAGYLPANVTQRGISARNASLDTLVRAPIAGSAKTLVSPGP